MCKSKKKVWYECNGRIRKYGMNDEGRKFESISEIFNFLFPGKQMQRNNQKVLCAFFNIISSIESLLDG